MIVVTGACGFIGSNLIKGLNDAGYKDILAIDDLTDSTKFRNLVDCDIYDYKDKEDFADRLFNFEKYDYDCIFHLGACSNTMENDGRFLMQNNYEYSKYLLEFSTLNNIPFIYASSASVYGNSDNPSPLNIYAYTKYLFDQYVKQYTHKKNIRSQVVGLRFYNVYGNKEAHKGNMASMVHQIFHQAKGDKISLFKGSDSFKRDFIHVRDVVDIHLHFLKNKISGLYNVGSGEATSFTELAFLIKEKTNSKAFIEYIDFPNNLLKSYQTFTQANITKLRDSGYNNPILDINDGLDLFISEI